MTMPKPTARSHSSSTPQSQPLDIFAYDDYVAYIRRQLEAEGRLTHRRLLNLSERLGYRSPRSLGMVLLAKRLPSRAMAWRLSEMFGHSEAEHRYFELLIDLFKFRSSQDLDAQRSVSERMAEAVPQLLPATELSNRLFSDVSDWFFLPVKQLVERKDFRSDPAWISKTLRYKITSEQAKYALQTLLRFGLIEERAGQYRVTESSVFTKADVPSDAVKKFHVQMLNRACEAIWEQKVEEREVNSLLCKIPAARFAEAKKELSQFVVRFAKKYHEGGDAALYSLNLQLFRLSD